MKNNELKQLFVTSSLNLMTTWTPQSVHTIKCLKWSYDITLHYLPCVFLQRCSYELKSSIGRAHGRTFWAFDIHDSRRLKAIGRPGNRHPTGFNEVRLSVCCVVCNLSKSPSRVMHISSLLRRPLNQHPSKLGDRLKETFVKFEQIWFMRVEKTCGPLAGACSNTSTIWVKFDWFGFQSSSW